MTMTNEPLHPHLREFLEKMGLETAVRGAAETVVLGVSEPDNMGVHRTITLGNSQSWIDYFCPLITRDCPHIEWKGAKVRAIPHHIFEIQI